MKKLKKGLSLVLVLVMVFGLATNAFAWDTTYADNDQITYKEAVEAMSGMGIIDGKLDNMFDPAGDYTREQAAKVITYMLLGPEAAKVLEQPTNTGFSDVDAERWSSGYIAYAAAQDIIVGWGGEFHPEDTLTRAQWLKMLLVALGYDPIENGLEDNLNWETNALTLALKVKLIDSKEATATFNRELAVQYGFNALQTDVVDKDGKPIPDGDDGNKTLSEDIFDLTKEPTQYDEFGRPYETWTGKDVVYATNYAEPVLYYSNKTVKAADVEKALGEGASITEWKTHGISSEGVEYGGKSTEIEIYKNTTGEKTYTAIVMALKAKQLDEEDLNNKAFADFEEGDVVTYFQSVDNEEIVYSNVTKVEPVEGTITAVATEYIRLDGEQIYHAATYTRGEGINPGANIKAYIDSYGNLIYAEVVQPAAPEARQPDGYAFVLESQAKAGQEGTTSGSWFEEGTEATAAAAKKQIIDLTGGKAGDKAKIVDVAVVQGSDKKWYYADKDGKPTSTEVTTDKADVDRMMAYYILDDGTYVFVEDGLKKNNNVEIKAGQAYYETASAYATKDTVLTVVSMDDMSNPNEIKNVETYTGYTNFPKDAFTADKALFVVDDKANITNIIAMVKAEDEVKPETKSVYAVSQGVAEEIVSDGEKAYRYSFYIVETGETVDYIATSELADVTSGKIFTVTFGADGKITNATAASATISGEVTRLEETYMVIESTTYNFAETYYVYGGELKVGATVELYVSNDKIEFVNVIPQAE